MKKILLLVSLNIVEIKVVSMQPQYIQTIPQMVSYGTPEVNAKLTGWAWFVQNFLIPFMALYIIATFIYIMKIDEKLKKTKIQN
jgi:hypothetical protein